MDALIKLITDLVSEQVSPGDSKPALEYLAGLVAVYNNANGKRVCEASISLLAPKHAFFKKEVSNGYR